MKAAVLEDVEKLVVRSVPEPQVPPREVALRVQAVGVCGTDLHIYRGRGNYNFDAQGRPIRWPFSPKFSVTNSQAKSSRWPLKSRT